MLSLLLPREVAGDQALPFSASSAVQSESVVLAGRGADLRDAVTHQPGPDGEDAVDAHGARRVPAALTAFQCWKSVTESGRRTWSKASATSVTASSSGLRPASAMLDDSP